MERTSKQGMTNAPLFSVQVEIREPNVRLNIDCSWPSGSAGEKCPASIHIAVNSVKGGKVTAEVSANRVKEGAECRGESEGENVDAQDSERVSELGGDASFPHVAGKDHESMGKGAATRHKVEGANSGLFFGVPLEKRLGNNLFAEEIMRGNLFGPPLQNGRAEGTMRVAPGFGAKGDTSRGLFTTTVKEGLVAGFDAKGDTSRGLFTTPVKEGLVTGVGAESDMSRRLFTTPVTEGLVTGVGAEGDMGRRLFATPVKENSATGVGAEGVRNRSFFGTPPRKIPAFRLVFPEEPKSAGPSLGIFPKKGSAPGSSAEDATSGSVFGFGPPLKNGMASGFGEEHISNDKTSSTGMRPIA